MNIKIIFNLKLCTAFFLLTAVSFAQQKLTKVSQAINVDKDVTINLNTSYSNIVFDTWNKDVIEIEAYVESDNLSKVELEKALKDWIVDIDVTKNLVTIQTKDNKSHTWAYNTHNGDDNNIVGAVIKELTYELEGLPEIIIESLGFDYSEAPELPELPELPAMPKLPELPSGMNNIQFDYQAYKKDGEKYLEEYTKQFETLFGEDYANRMEAWGEKFGNEWGEKYGKQMEAWGEQLAKKMEHQAARTEAQVERAEAMKERAEAIRERRLEQREHIKNREKLIEERKVLIEKLADKKSNVKKTIKIKMPKNTKLKVNVRHGELTFAANIDNLKANLSHTKFVANSINGSRTSINASYSPIKVLHWNLGELNLSYVEKAELNNVKRLVLSSNSSNVTIQNLLGNAVIDSNIGDLQILNIDDAFSNLNVILQNTDALIALPSVDYNLQYKGANSQLSHPKKSKNNNESSFSTGNLSGNKTIIVNAKYSDIVMK